MDSKAECCTDHDSESGCRNNYFDGKRLTTDSFRVEQRYFLDRRRLLNRAMYGWGVVYGFKIRESGGRLKIGPGLALDPCGRELIESGTRQAGLDDLVIVDEKGARADRERVFSSAGHERVCWLLSAHYAEKPAGSVTVDDSCHCQRQEWDRTCETVRYSLRRIPCGDCCREEECELTCTCGSGPCCDDRRTEAPPRRGGCRCICDHLTNLDPNAENCSLCEIEDPCGRVRVDLRNGVPLACVSLVRDQRDCWTLGDVEPCGPRRLVKRNDLLYDLIRGCDLTRISEIGWRDWHRRTEPVSFDEFSAAFGDEAYRQHEYVTRLFWVEFSRPVRRNTVRPDCFTITILSGEDEGGWWSGHRVPIVRVETEAGEDDPDEHISKATLVVSGGWVEDGLRGRHTVFRDGEAYVEIEIRGDFIVDCNGQTVDADALGLSPAPTGNGTPGGTFVSSFRVAEAPRYAYATEDRVKGASS